MATGFQRENLGRVAPSGGRGHLAPSSPRSWRPWPLVLDPTSSAHLAEHLVPIEDGLPLLLHLQLPPLLGAFHTL